jgi:CspA family cold shock protein
MAPRVRKPPASAPSDQDGTEKRMAYGTVTWFDAERGDGFISRAGFVSRDNGGAEIFVHQSQINGDRPHHIGEGDRVTFTLEPHADGLRAADVQPIS